MSQKDSRSALQKAQDRLGALTSSLTGNIWSQHDTYTFPAFDDLPKVPNQPQGCMWGFYDKDGKKDEVGCTHSLPRAVVRPLNKAVLMQSVTSSNQPPHTVRRESRQSRGPIRATRPTGLVARKPAVSQLWQEDV